MIRGQVEAEVSKENVQGGDKDRSVKRYDILKGSSYVIGTIGMEQDQR